MDCQKNKKKQNKNDKQRLEKDKNIESKQQVNTQIPNSDEIIKLDLDNKFSKRKIISNWSKYENDNIEFENNTLEVNSEHTLAADFEKLLHMPAAVGSHFVFKTEKIWDTENSNLYGKFSEIFCMNLSLLQESITSIPFNERLGYDKDFFSIVELELLNIKAQKVSEQYKISQSNLKSVKNVKEPAQILRDKNTIELNRKKNNKNDQFNTNKYNTQSESSCKISISDNQQRDMSFEKLLKEQITQNQPDLSKKNVENTLNKVPIVIEHKNNENIQQWLDDILDN